MISKEQPICVIEDNTPIRKLFCTLLKKAGYSTSEFADGATACQWLRQNKPLVVITDILLPDQNGTDILSLIRSMPDGNAIPVIAVTGFAHANDKDKYIALGFDSYIPKPINTSSFVSEVEAVINDKLG